MEEGIGWTIIVVAILILLIAGFRFLPGGIYWCLAIIGFITFFSLDQLFSAALAPQAPWLMWIIWGAVIGAAFAFWTIAPVYGFRQHRRLIMLSPLGLMAMVAVIRLLLRK